MPELVKSDFRFVCRQCGKTFVHSQEHQVNVLPVFTSVECTECLTIVENPGSPDPIRTGGVSLRVVNQ